MDVQINEVSSTVEVIDRELLLTPDFVARIAAAVHARSEAERSQQHDRAADVDFRSVVEQQRAGRR